MLLYLRGKEFVSLKEALQQRHIKLTLKAGLNKANFAEVNSDTVAAPLLRLTPCCAFQNAIGTVKRRLYSFLHSGGVKDWPKALPKITQNLNNTPMKALGFLAPNQVQSGLDEPQVRAAKAELASKMNPKQRERFFPETETYSDMLRNVATFDSKSQTFSCGQFVYKDIVPDKLAKSTDNKRGEVFIVSEIIKSKNIPRYKLINLNKVELPGTS